MSVNTAADVWAKVRELMQKSMTPVTMSTWFDDTTAVELEEDRLILTSPTPFKRDIISKRYAKTICDALRELFSSEFRVSVLSPEEAAALHEPKKSAVFSGTEGYTFDNFVVGSSNKFAHAAACAVADMPGLEKYNPLFIYGGSGLGKTHLLHAIAHKVRADHPDWKIVYIKGDTFTNELIQAIRSGRNQEFRDKYRFADVFLMDDVQFIAGRASTEEEFFNTFNNLYEAGRSIVLTSDRPPKDMLRLEDRLKSRFEWGLIADIQPPDYETRMAIIKNKCILAGLDMPDFLLQLIAENITANVRQLEGTLNKVMAYQELMDKDQVDKDTVLKAITVLFKERADIVPTAEVIIDEVCAFYNTEAELVRGQDQTKTVSLARQIAMYLVRHQTSLTLKDIGAEFGRDHATVLYAIRRVEQMVKTQPEIAEIVKDITANIKARYE